MKSTTARRFQQVLSLIGCMFLLMPGGMDLYWGGISVYALSLIVSYINSDFQIELPVTLSLFFITWASAFILSGSICKRIGKEWVILLGLVISNVAVYSSYFAIQKSFLFFNIVFAGFGGFGFGITYGIALHIVAHSAGKNVGLFTSLLITSDSIGAIMITQLITWYTNPENQVPTWKIGSTAYFTQRDVVDRIPSTFLVLGGVLTSTNMVGMIILFFITAAISSKHAYKEITETSVLKYRDCEEIEEKEGCSRNTITNTSISHDSASDMSPNKGKDYTPKDMLKTTTFYCLFLSLPITELSYIIVINYYKLFGQVFFKDDHFLSTIGTISTFTTVFSRAVNGVALDTFGVRNCLVVLHIFLTIVMSWFYFSAMVGPWIYLLATVFYFNVSCVTYSTFYSAIPLLFGNTHVTTNLGILIIPSVALNPMAPFMIEKILANYGWSALFGITSGLNIGALILCILFLP